MIVTIIAAILVMVLAATGLGIGLILTGKSKLHKRCGFIPGKKDGTDSSCSICGEKKVCDKQEVDHDNDEHSK